MGEDALRAPPGTPRLLPQVALPDYRYVPGRGPHPNKHAGGHNILETIEWGQPAWEPNRSWESDRRYLYGHDLFAHRYYWESHEVWEEMWHAIPLDRAERRLIQGLIQAAATTLKNHMGHARARGRLADRAAVHLRAAAEMGERQTIWGVEIPDLIAQLEQRVDWPVVVLHR